MDKRESVGAEFWSFVLVMCVDLLSVNGLLLFIF